MKIDFSAKITAFDGTDILEDDKPVTLAIVAVNALVTPLPDQRGQPEQIDGMTKVRNASLAERIFKDGKKADLTVEEVALIKERVGRAYGPLAVMRAWSLLEQHSS